MPVILDPAAETILRIALGAIVLLVGRNLFWLFIGIVGFFLGIDLAAVWLTDGPPWLLAVVAAVVGLIGALVAIVFERIAFAIAGFYAGAYIVVTLAASAGYSSIPVAAAIVAGVAGAVVAALLMDWVIIVLSALAGAVTIASTLPVAPIAQAAVAAVLTVIGVSVQRAWLVRDRARRSDRS